MQLTFRDKTYECEPTGSVCPTTGRPGTMFKLRHADNDLTWAIPHETIAGRFMITDLHLNIVGYAEIRMNADLLEEVA